MKLGLSLIPLLIFVFSAFGQTTSDLQAKIRAAENGRFYSVDYDKFENTSQVSFSAFKISAEKGSEAGIPSVNFGTDFSFDGQELKTPAQKFQIKFTSVSDHWVFAGDHSLIFFVDGARVDLGEGLADGEANSLIGNDKKTTIRVSISETMTYTTDRAKFEQIASGNQVEFQLGTFKGRLNDESKQMLKFMLGLSIP